MEPKYGIIGCGGISQYYFSALKKLNASITHLVDLDIEKARECAKASGAKYSTDYMDAIKDPDVSAVIVLAHTKFHKEICLQAIAAGKDVICEKTLANNAEESSHIVNAAQKAGVQFFTAYMKRFFPALKKAKDIMPSLGIIFSAYARSYQVWGDLYQTKDLPVNFWIDRYGGGVLKCAGSHILDLILFLFGRPNSLYANIDLVEKTNFDRKATVLLEYPKSLVVNFEAAGHPLKKIGYQRNGWDERIEINGTNGRLDIYTTTWNKPEECAALLVHYDNTTETSTEYRFEAENVFDIQVEHFHKCLSTKKQGNSDGIDGFCVDALISAIAESGKKKQPVDIDWRGF